MTQSLGIIGPVLTAIDIAEIFASVLDRGPSIEDVHSNQVEKLRIDQERYNNTLRLSNTILSEITILRHRTGSILERLDQLSLDVRGVGDTVNNIDNRDRINNDNPPISEPPPANRPPSEIVCPSFATKKDIELVMECLNSLKREVETIQRDQQERGRDRQELENLERNIKADLERQLKSFAFDLPFDVRTRLFDIYERIFKRFDNLDNSHRLNRRTIGAVQEDTQEINATTTAIGEIVGAPVGDKPAQFPIETFSNLVDEKPEDKKIETLPELLLWVVEQIDGIAGQFPIDIEIKDTDAVKAGEQSKKVQIFNLAEGIAELYGQASLTNITQSAQTQISLRSVSELVSLKVATLVSQDLIRVVVDCMGARTRREKREFNLAFKVGGDGPVEKLSELLQNSTGTFAGFEYDREDAVFEYLERLMFAASIVKGAFFKGSSRLEPEVDGLRDYLETVGGWENFVEQIEDRTSDFNKGQPEKIRVKQKVVEEGVEDSE